MWIHGGGFLSGDGRPESFGPQYLVSAFSRKHDHRTPMFVRFFFITFVADYGHNGHVLCHFIWDLILAINSVFTSDGVWGCGGDDQLQTLHTRFPQVLRKNNCTVCRFLSCWLLLCLYNPSHSLGTEEVPGNMGMLDQVNFVSFCNNFLIVTKLGCCATLGSGEHCIFWRRSSQGDLHQEPPHCPVEKNQLC